MFVRDDVETVFFPLLNSLCALVTDAMHERRFCFADTTGLSPVDADLFGDADEFLAGAGQKFGDRKSVV